VFVVRGEIGLDRALVVGDRRFDVAPDVGENAEVLLDARA